MGFIVLLGPKHAGKTSTGRELARRLLLPFFDLDALIEERSGQSPRQLYTAGPQVFHREETAALADLLHNPAGADTPGGIIAAGGGIIDNPQAMYILEQARANLAVYLDISAETAWKRIAGTKELPPFLKADTTASSEEKHRLLHERRARAYRNHAELVISAEGKTPSELADEIAADKSTFFIAKSRKSYYIKDMNQEQFFSAILNNVHDGIITLDKNLYISFVNPAATKMSQWEKVPLNRQAAQVFILLEPKNLSNLLTKNLPQNDVPFLFKDAIYKCGSHTLIVDGSIARIPEENSGEAQGYVIVIRDISDMKKLSATLDYHVSHDALTGLSNREGFSMQLEDVLDSVKRIGKNAALLQINLDSYDTVKTESGDSGGNALLGWFAGVLQSHVKSRDISARLGGCVFSLVLFDCTTEEAEKVAQRIHSTMAEGFTFEERLFPLAASIGIVSINEKAAFAAGLLSAADAACNAAKKAGSGKTVL